MFQFLLLLLLLRKAENFDGPKCAKDMVPMARQLLATAPEVFFQSADQVLFENWYKNYIFGIVCCEAVHGAKIRPQLFLDNNKFYAKAQKLRNDFCWAVRQNGGQTAIDEKAWEQFENVGIELLNDLDKDQKVKETIQNAFQTNGAKKAADTLITADERALIATINALLAGKNLPETNKNAIAQLVWLALDKLSTARKGGANDDESPATTVVAGGGRRRRLKRADDGPTRRLRKNCVLLLLGILFSVVSGLFILHQFLKRDGASVLLWLAFLANSVLFALQAIHYTSRCAPFFSNRHPLDDMEEPLHSSANPTNLLFN